MKHWEGSFSGSILLIYSLAHKRPNQQRTLKAFDMSVIIINLPCALPNVLVLCAAHSYKQLTCRFIFYAYLGTLVRQLIVGGRKSCLHL